MKIGKKAKSKTGGAVLGFLLALSLILSLGTLAFAAAPPPIPHWFSGAVTIGAHPAPAGTVVSARVVGVEVASTAVDAAGNYGFGVSATPGATIDFYVAGVWAVSHPWVAGGETLLNLAIPGVPPPARFILTVTIDPPARGTVSLIPPQPAEGYLAGTVVTLTASPASGYTFSHWSGHATGISPTVSITMDAHKSVTAHFAAVAPPPPARFILTVTIDPPARGTVSLSPPQPAEGYLAGTVVTLTATPVAGFTFSHWSGDATGVSPTVSITMDRSKSVTAHFAAVAPPPPARFFLTVTIDPPASGTVSLSPSQPAEGYWAGMPVTLTATPASGFRFSHWSGHATGTSPTVSITMTWHKNVTAHFEAVVVPPPARYALTVTIAPPGSGTVSLSPTQPAAGYVAGTLVTLTAKPAADHEFDRWSGDATGTEPTTTVTMTRHKSVTAHFSPLPGVTAVADFITPEGVFTEEVIAQSFDGLAGFTIAEDTVGLINEQPVAEIVMVQMQVPPPPPDDTEIIGLVYDAGPDGATFDPPMTLTITYDPALIPEGVAEEDLVIAFWDAVAGEWVELASIVDPVANTITARVSHFTAFTILARIRPAEFTVTGLTITPREVYTGEEVTITALVANIGDLRGTHKVTLKIDGVVAATQEVILDGGASREVRFTVSRDVAANYGVDIAGLTGAFVVKARPAEFTVTGLTITPREVYTGEKVTIGALVANIGDLRGTHEVILKIDGVIEFTVVVILDGGATQRVRFTVTRDVVATYAVTVDRLTGTFRVKAPPAPAEFTTTALTITPDKMHTWEEVTISALITNVGDLRGTHQVILKIDNVIEATYGVTLDGGASQVVTFTISRDIARSYAVNVNGELGRFEVMMPPEPLKIPWPLIRNVATAGIIIGAFILWMAVTP